MTLSDEEFEQFLDEVLAIDGDRPELYVPIDAPSSIEEITFRGFGISASSDDFNLGWTFYMQRTSQSRYLKAFARGSIFFKNGSPNRIIFRNGDVLGQVIRGLGRLRDEDTLPFWFPLPHYIIYENVDTMETEEIIRNYLEANPEIVASLNNNLDGPAEDRDEWVARFIDEDLPIGIPVNSGQTIGVAGDPDPSDISRLSEKTVNIYMQEMLDNSDGLFLDPAIYHHHWQPFFQNLRGNPLETELQRIFAGPIANGIVRYVKIDGGDSGDFTNRNSPARLPSLALQAADPYDTILILDDGLYSEPGELSISIPINLTSLCNIDVMTAGDAHNMPIISGNSDHRVININNIAGMLSISNIEISSGHFRYSGSEDVDPRPARGGAGIAIQYSEKVYIRNCMVKFNEVEMGEGRGLDNGYGGGIHVFHSEAYIYRNQINDNQARYRGGGIGVCSYGWPTIENNLINNNRAFRDGGGIAITIAENNESDLASLIGANEDNLIRYWDAGMLRRARRRRMGLFRNEIARNTAADDGGGIYLSVLSRAELKNNIIHHNQAGGDGGGIRVTLGSWLSLKGDEIHHNSSNSDQRADTNSGGGGISIRNSTVFLRDVEVNENTAYGFAGGGIYFISSDEGEIFSDFTVDYNDILRIVFGATRFCLSLQGECTIRNNSSTMLPGQTGDHRKGGGIYILRFQSDDSQFTALPLDLRFERITAARFFNENNLMPPPEIPGSEYWADLYIDDMVTRRGDPIHLGNIDALPGWDPTDDLFTFRSD